jgi:tripartite-type tricarboxylate transporter receptor subunit TctC
LRLPPGRTTRTAKISRRGFLRLAAGAAAFPPLLTSAGAQAYPSRPVRWIVGFAPGGGNDLVARLMGQRLSERLGQAFVIENRPGAAGNLAADAVVHARPDGYTLLLVSSNNATNAAVFENLGFDFVRDIAPVAGIGRTPLLMAVNPSVPAKTVPEFIAYTKANPGKVNIGSAGTGGIGHLAGEQFKMMAGVDMTHVPYRGNGPALTGLLGGEVQVLFPSLASSLEFVSTGKLNALAVASAQRTEKLPALPTVAESVPGFEASTWYGVGAPRGTPAAIVERIHAEIDAILAEPQLIARFAELGDVPRPMTPDGFGKYIAEETDKWRKVAKFAGVKAE